VSHSAAISDPADNLCDQHSATWKPLTIEGRAFPVVIRPGEIEQQARYVPSHPATATGSAMLATFAPEFHD
jgi:hypothetical protein